eukprot:355368-Chlamydomonas_euryale.AAC.19
MSVALLFPPTPESPILFFTHTGIPRHTHSHAGCFQAVRWPHTVRAASRAVDVAVSLPCLTTPSFPLPPPLPPLQGVAGLWRGLTPYVLRRVPSTSLSFSFKDALLQVLPGGPSAAGGGGSMQGGGTGGSMQGEGGVGRPKACGGSASGTDGGCCSGHTTRLMRNLAAGVMRTRRGALPCRRGRRSSGLGRPFMP